VADAARYAPDLPRLHRIHPIPNVHFLTFFRDVSDEAAEERLGITFEALECQAISVEAMLGGADGGVKLGEDSIKQVKEKVYDDIMDYIQFEGYPTPGRGDHSEANVNDLVLYTIGPILAAFNKETERNILLRREKEIVAMDSVTTGRC